MQMLQNLWFQVQLTLRLLQDPRVPVWKKAIPMLGVLYVLSPLDLIPDFVLVLGQLDDIGIALLAMRLFESSVDHKIVSEHRNALKRKNGAKFQLPKLF
ncbi:MAG: DUF1232 domain-containing protein [Anaerolineae bacterium]|jgi:uncharacterized membrane protein YkvA (DUF1232 family)|nr:DUF1232 domain-containing protein [Anaerolineae bacterium]